MILKQESERERTRRGALFRFLTTLVPLLVLVACGHPVGVLVPISDTVPGTTITDLLVVTTREPSGNPGTLYSGKRDPQFSLDEIKVSIPPDSKRKIGEIQWPKRLPANPATDFATVAVDHLPPTRKAASTWLNHNLPKSRDVLVFVHGFNNTYEDAVYRFAQIFHDSRTDAAPVLFTWPSAAKLFDYNYDRESTNYSRDALENLLKGLVQDPKVHEVSVLAHSMGTWLAMESLRQMAIRDGRVAPKIRNVIFASPDIDIDVFAHQWRDLGKNRPKFTIFVSQDDRALAVSRFIAGNVNRLGQINPEQEPYKSAIEKNGITVIDLTKLRTNDSTNHAKFAESPEVVRAIGTRLVAGQTLTQSQIGLGDEITILAAGTAKAVGTGVGLAASVPISIVDPNTRRNLKSQAEDLTGQIGDATGITRPQASDTADTVFSGQTAGSSKQ